MRHALRFRPSPAGILAFIALAVAIGGVAVASIPDSSGLIHACFNSSNGNLRVVEDAANCRNSESPISWGQQGPPATAKLTRLHFSDVTQVAAGPNYQLAKTVGSFTKEASATTVRINWLGLVNTFNGSCEYQLRVDGRKDTGSSSTSVESDSGGSVVIPSAVASRSVHAMTLFDGLSAGEHSVSIWVRHFNSPSPDICILGTFEADAPTGQDVFVEQLRT